MVHKRYRDWTESINNQINAITFTPMQHKAIIINLHITLKADYFEHQNKDNCPYDLQKARAGPALIQTEIENTKLDNTPIEDLWGETHNKLLTTLIKKFPKKPKQKPTTQYITNYKIKQADCQLFGLIKERAKIFKTKLLRKTWKCWTKQISQSSDHIRPYSWEKNLKHTQTWANQITEKIALRKKWRKINVNKKPTKH